MQDINKYKEILTKEMHTLENELQTVGRRNPSNPEDWEAVEGGVKEEHNAEDGDVADAIESLDTNSAVLDQLEMRMNEVKRALERIDEGTYGKCEVCGAQIEEDRLEANPAAKTCKEHMNQ